MGRLTVIILMLLAPNILMAQEDPEYRAEIGGGIGLVSYQGALIGRRPKKRETIF